MVTQQDKQTAVSGTTDKNQLLLRAADAGLQQQLHYTLSEVLSPIEVFHYRTHLR